MSHALRAFKSELFKVLAHPGRIHVLELLRAGEKTVSELQAQMQVDSSSVSQQLAVLRGRHLVVGRKDGTSVYYRVTDPSVFVLLDVAREMFGHHLGTLQAVAAEEERAASTERAETERSGARSRE
jgi:DNA-binding transcriptional ArsR family regulator